MSNEAKETNNLFPIFLKLENYRVLIVGGGKIGLEKVNAVLNNSPATAIHLVAPDIKEEIYALAKQHSNLELIKKEYAETDLDNIDFVIVAVNYPEVSKQILAEAHKRKLLVNVADNPALCDFYLSSTVQKGNLKIAISTNGKSPTIGKRLKELFNELLPDEIDSLLDNLQAIRNRLKGDFSHKVHELNELTKGLVSNDNIKN
jgi:siroheme synthase-like protein